MLQASCVSLGILHNWQTWRGAWRCVPGCVCYCWDCRWSAGREGSTPDRIPTTTGATLGCCGPPRSRPTSSRSASTARGSENCEWPSGTTCSWRPRQHRCHAQSSWNRKSRVRMRRHLLSRSSCQTLPERDIRPLLVRMAFWKLDTCLNRTIEGHR